MSDNFLHNSLKFVLIHFKHQILANDAIQYITILHHRHYNCLLHHYHSCTVLTIIIHLLWISHQFTFQTVHLSSGTHAIVILGIPFNGVWKEWPNHCHCLISHSTLANMSALSFQSSHKVWSMKKNLKPNFGAEKLLLPPIFGCTELLTHTYPFQDLKFTMIWVVIRKGTLVWDHFIGPDQFMYYTTFIRQSEGQ